MINQIFTDLDYTLTNFDSGHFAGIEQLKKMYGSAFASRFETWFRMMLEGLRVKDEDWRNFPGGKKAFLRFRRELTTVQNYKSTVSKEYILNEWSREVASMWIAKSLNMDFSEEDAKIASDLYWKSVADNSPLYPDASEFLGLLKRKGIPYHIFTSSDARLKWDGKSWVYDPDYSRAQKMLRIKALESQGVFPTSITIGDPVDKPNPEFYQYMVINAEKTCEIDPQKCITVGDSFNGDVSSPINVCNFSKGYWIPNRSAQAVKMGDKIFSISKLTDIDLL